MSEQQMVTTIVRRYEAEQLVGVEMFVTADEAREFAVQWEASYSPRRAEVETVTQPRRPRGRR